MPLYGNELDRETNPFEANLGRVVKLEKGEFVGSRRARGRPAGRTGAQAHRPRDGRQRHPARGLRGPMAGEAVGRVTSGTLSPTLGSEDRDGHGPRPAAGVGNAFEVVVRDRPYRAEQVKLPFYRRPRD